MSGNDFIHLYFSSVPHISVYIYINLFLLVFHCLANVEGEYGNVIHNYRRSIKYMGAMS